MASKNRNQGPAAQEFTLATGACCSGKECCDACCIGMAKMGVPAKNFPRVAYVFISILWMLVSIILLFTLRVTAESWDWFQCSETA